ncbi:MAG: enoyl-ACP reductase FabV [Chloroflexota bacterium]|nr:enoyl-[acyl-carrier-protein] reductase FabV [Chloroflexota bacterium]MEC7787901.1 enoyl-ACP reductase FabV [Chloroflexota bacterium]
MAEFLIEPRIRGFISLTSHPAGCAKNIDLQIERIRSENLPMGQKNGLQNVLVIGSSTGYGLGAALAACFGYGANVLGVCFERKPEGEKPGSAGWYNSARASETAAQDNLIFQTINGDAFSDDIKNQTIESIKKEYGKIDLVIYSLAAPRRNDAQGNVWNSVLKPIDQRYEGKSFDLRKESITDISIEPATADEILGTQKVMGGEDWQEWIELLAEQNLLADGARTVAFSYIGPEITQALYRNGTIGEAKKHLENTAIVLDKVLSQTSNNITGTVGGAWISVNKAVVTQASSAIPVVGLYMSILFRLLNERNENESTCDQGIRLLRDHLAPHSEPRLDEAGRIRLDDFEMADDVQHTIAEIWPMISNNNFADLADWPYFKKEFANLFGFEISGVDYSLPVEVDIPLNS